MKENSSKNHMITSLFSAAVLAKGYNSALRLDKHVNDVTYTQYDVIVK